MRDAGCGMRDAEGKNRNRRNDSIAPIAPIAPISHLASRISHLASPLPAPLTRTGLSGLPRGPRSAPGRWRASRCNRPTAATGCGTTRPPAPRARRGLSRKLASTNPVCSDAPSMAPLRTSPSTKNRKHPVAFFWSFTSRRRNPDVRADGRATGLRRSHLHGRLDVSPVKNAGGRGSFDYALEEADVRPGIVTDPFPGCPAAQQPPEEVAEGAGRVAEGRTGLGLHGTVVECFG